MASRCCNRSPMCKRLIIGGQSYCLLTHTIYLLPTDFKASTVQLPRHLVSSAECRAQHEGQGGQWSLPHPRPVNRMDPPPSAAWPLPCTITCPTVHAIIVPMSPLTQPCTTIALEALPTLLLGKSTAANQCTGAQLLQKFYSRGVLIWM